LGSGMREFKDSISGDSSQPTISQTTQQPQPAAVQQPVPVEQAAQAFGEGAPEQAPVEPTRQA
jgi:hypothetical protein